MSQKLKEYAMEKHPEYFDDNYTIWAEQYDHETEELRDTTECRVCGDMFTDYSGYLICEDCLDTGELEDLLEALF